jgi:glycerol-3-phosphate dehydrogenase (NAD(P)+)
MAPEDRVAVLGAGSWGTAVAAVAARSAPTVIWARRAELAASISDSHRNSEYLPELDLPRDLSATADLADAAAGAGLIVMAVPSHGFRAVLSEAAPSIGAGVPVLSLTKGLESESLKRMTEVIGEVAPDHPAGVLTGPNLAHEVVSGQPTASVVAIPGADLAHRIQLLLSTDTFRVYTNRDVVGCEMAGALKNVIAIAAGMADGLGFGDNSMAALITRGLAELTRLGVAMGGQPLTFSGLAGMGDLVATCISRQSRNRFVGHELGTGKTLPTILGEMRMVAEGVKTAPAAVTLARQHGVEVPIAEQVLEVIQGRQTAEAVMPTLMSRRAKAEMHGIDTGHAPR